MHNICNFVRFWFLTTKNMTLKTQKHLKNKKKH